MAYSDRWDRLLKSSVRIICSDRLFRVPEQTPAVEAFGTAVAILRLALSIRPQLRAELLEHLDEAFQQSIRRNL